MKKESHADCFAEAHENGTSQIILKVRDKDLQIDSAPNGSTFINITVPSKRIELPNEFFDTWGKEMQRHGFTEIESEEFMEELFGSVTKASQLKVLKAMLIV